MKVVNDLARQGVLDTTRGRGGGVRLRADPARLRIGDIVRASETDFRLVECFDPATAACTLTPSCRLTNLFGSALQAYFDVLDAATLADIVPPAAAAAKSAPAPGCESAPPKPVVRRVPARAGTAPRLGG